MVSLEIECVSESTEYVQQLIKLALKFPKRYKDHKLVKFYVDGKYNGAMTVGDYFKQLEEEAKTEK